MIVANGDSNTQSNTRDGWVEQLGVLRGEPVINRGVGGSTICDSNVIVFGMPFWGGYYIDKQLTNVDPFESLAIASGTPGMFFGQSVQVPFPIPDIQILAFGTNDVPNFTPSQIITMYKKYRQHLLQEGIKVYIATTPPRWANDGTPAYDESIRSLNQKVRGNWPTRYIEFYEGFSRSDFASDGLHLTPEGRTKRAVRAAEGLA